MRRILLATTTFLSAALSTTAAAQDRAAIQGTITTADTREPVVTARVSVVNPPRSALTDEDGRYVLRDLPPGDYTVTVTAVGRVAFRQSLTVNAGESATLDAKLEPGSLLLSNVVISANRFPMDARRLASNVSVLNSEQIRLSPARETQDLLREVSGVELPRVSNEVGGTAQFLAMRGADEGRVLVLLDGVPLNDFWGEWIDWSKAPKAMIDRVEVFEGGGSHIYGSGAMGGVVSLFSRAIAPGDYRLVVDGGSRDAKHLFGSAGFSLAPSVSLSLTGDYGDAGGYKLLATPGAGPADFPSQSHRGNGVARLEYAPSSNVSAFLTTQFFHDDRRVEGQLGRTLRTDGMGVLGVTVGAADPGLVTTRLWFGTNVEDQYLSTMSAFDGTNRAVEHTTTWYKIPSTDLGANLSWSRADVGPFTNLGAGIEYRILSGSFDEHNYVNSAEATPTTNFNSRGRQTLRGVYLTSMFVPREQWSVELSLRSDWWENSDGVTSDDTGISPYPSSSRKALAPRIGVQYTLDSSLVLHAAGYQAYRAPNIGQMFRKSIQNSIALLPNTELLPEFVMAWEAGADWQPMPWVQLKGTAYRANYRDLSVLSNVGGDARQRTSSFFSRSIGAQVSVALKPIESLDVSGSINLDDARVTNPGGSGLQKNVRVPRVPLQRVIIRASHRSSLAGALTAQVRYEGKSTTTGGRLLKDYRLYDLSWERGFGADRRLFLSVENLFNVAYTVNSTGNGNNALTTLGMPLTIRLGLEATRF